MNDLVLLDQLRNSNQKAFEKIYVRYWDPLFKMAFKKVHDRDIAQGIVQDIFESLWKNRETTTIHSLIAYLVFALKFQVFKYYRSESVKEKYLNFQLTRTKNTFIDSLAYKATEMQDVVRQTFDRLPCKTQQIFYLSRGKQLSNKEISMHLKKLPLLGHLSFYAEIGHLIKKMEG